jgi:hypothetical protein
MWVDPRAGLDILEKRKISCTSQDSNPRSSSPLVSTRAYGRMRKSVSSWVTYATESSFMRTTVAPVHVNLHTIIEYFRCIGYAVRKLKKGYCWSTKIYTTTESSLDVHASVHHSTNHIEITNKMQPCTRIYYFIVLLLAQHVSSNPLLIIRSSKTVITASGFTYCNKEIYFLVLQYTMSVIK